MNIPLTSNPFRTRRQNFSLGSLIIFCIFGAIFTGAGILSLNATKINPDWTKVQGEIVSATSQVGDGSTTYAPVIRYSVNGQAFKVGSSISTGSYPKIGERREVAYDPTNPANAKVVETLRTQWFVYIFPLIGTGFIILGLTLFTRSYRRNRAIRQLTEQGQKLQGVLVDIQSVNNNSYKIVVAATAMGGAAQNYVSDTIGGIGDLMMADFHKNPIPIDVYVDTTNPQNYYVDISDIPNLTPERIGELLKTATQNIQPKTEKSPTPPPTDPHS